MHAGEVAHRSGAHDARAIERPLVEQCPRETRQVVRGAEQPSMRDWTLKEGGILVVHLAAQQPATPGIALGGRGAGEPLFWRQIARVVHAERYEHASHEISVERLPAHALDDEPEEHGADVRVDHAGTGDRVERCRHEERTRRVRSGSQLPELAERRQSRRVREELTHRHALLVAAGPFREVALHRRVEHHAPLFHELHHRGGHAQHLGERCHVPDGIEVGRRCVRGPVDAAGTHLRQDPTTIADHSDRSREHRVPHSDGEDRAERILQRGRDHGVLRRAVARLEKPGQCDRRASMEGDPPRECASRGALDRIAASVRRDVARDPTELTDHVWIGERHHRDRSRDRDGVHPPRHMRTDGEASLAFDRAHERGKHHTLIRTEQRIETFARRRRRDPEHTRLRDECAHLGAERASRAHV